MNEEIVALCEYSKKLSEKSYVIGPGGNTSCKIGTKLYIKPSGLTFAEMVPEDYVEVDIETGEVTPGQKRMKPSSEINMHRFIYQKRPDVSCIFHAHPPVTIGLAAANRPFKHLYPDSVAYLGKEILVLNYCVPTTNILAEYVRDNLGEHNAIVLKNHGSITLGKNIKTTYLRMEMLETLAYSIWIAASTCGNNPIEFLSDTEMDEIINLDAEKYRTKLYEPGKK